MNEKLNDNIERKQIEEWTGMKVDNIIFDSDFDNWNLPESIFIEKVLNKSNLIFLIEEENGNLFGGYINAKIDGISVKINDPKGFIFSLKSNERLNGMLKFNIKDSEKAFWLYSRFYGGLFSIGNGDISIRKERFKTNSICRQESFSYNGIESALCGKLKFTPTRITVVQLI